MKFVHGDLRDGHKSFALGCIFTFASTVIATFDSTALMPHLNILIDHLIAHTW